MFAGTIGATEEAKLIQHRLIVFRFGVANALGLVKVLSHLHVKLRFVQPWVARVTRSNGP